MMALAGVKLETLVFKPCAFCFSFLYYRSTRIIDNGASRCRTRNALASEPDALTTRPPPCAAC